MTTTPTRWGPEKIVTGVAQAGTQSDPVAAALTNGGYVAAYSNGSDIEARRFDVLGNPVGAAIPVATGVANQQQPSVTGLQNGGFVVSWTQNNGGSNEILAQRYDANGSPAGVLIGVNSILTNDQQNSSITTLANGDFVVVWQDASTTDATADYDIMFQRYSANGVALGGNVRLDVMDSDTEPDTRPAVAGLANGSFVIFWHDQIPHPTPGELPFDRVRMALVNALGVPILNDFDVTGSQTTTTQAFPSVAALTGGGFVATWREDNGFGLDTEGGSIVYRVYAEDGQQLLNSKVANLTVAGTQSEPTVAALSDGGFIITWTDGSSTGGDASGEAIRGQRFDAGGKRVGMEFLVNTTTTSDQQDSAAIMLADGRVLVVYEDDSNFGVTGTDLRLQILDAREATINGSNGNDALTAREGDSTVRGYEGNDVLHGRGGDDALIGGAGNDTLSGAAGDDSVAGGSGSDSVFVSTGEDTVYGGSGGDYLDFNAIVGSVAVNLAAKTATLPGVSALTFGGIEHLAGTAGGDNLIGNLTVNAFFGRGGNDTLFGGAGNDILTGGAGADQLTGSFQADTFDFNLTSETPVAAFDIVTDFSKAQADKIDLSGIDAIEGGANNAFAFIGTAAFSAAGQARAVQSGAHTIVALNTIGTSGAEAWIQLSNFTATTLAAGDFVL